uniref:Tc1-like transposase DDE domain-containing protein n=1 Tax=Oncorhynchus tshawytscha TaxID=74940 RepID=A0AAZ3PQH3_ONCTS
MGLPITTSCDTAWNRTRVCSDASSTEMQCVRILHHLGAQHTSRLCKGYLTKKENDLVLHQMTWPLQSPNFNPIEMVLDELDHGVKEKQPTSAQHMWERLQDCWKSIPGEAD